MKEKTEKNVAVITGASGGIGKGIARYFLENNYRTILIARRVDRLEDLINEFSENSIKVVSIDLRNNKEILERTHDIIKNEKKIDVLVNSAGYVKSGTSTISHDEFVKMLEINLVGLLDITNEIIPVMKKQHSGRIINISSYSGIVARESLGGYAASKFGLMGLNEALYKELAPYGIYVTAVCPNLVDTEMTQDVDSIERKDFIQVSDVIKTIDYLLNLESNVMVKELVLRCRAQLLEDVDR